MDIELVTVIVLEVEKDWDTERDGEVVRDIVVVSLTLTISDLVLDSVKERVSVAVSTAEPEIVTGMLRDKVRDFVLVGTAST